MSAKLIFTLFLFSIISILPIHNFSAETDIAYRTIFGSIGIKAPFPNEEFVGILIKPRNGPPISDKVQAQGGFISWQSPPLPPGFYEITFILPAGLPSSPKLTVIVHNGEHLRLTPKLTKEGSIHVVANVPEAVFLLRRTKESQVWKGGGSEFTFWNLPIGSYFLSFSTNNSEYFIPPAEMRLYLSDSENKEVKASFQIVGKLTIKINVAHSHVTIQEIGGQQKTYQDEITDYIKAFKLPEGHYTISLSSVSSEGSEVTHLSPPDPVEVYVRALNSEELNLSFRTGNAQALEKQRRLIITANIASAGYTIKKIEGEKSEKIGHFSGKYTQMTLPKAESYEITFDDIPNYQSPEKNTIQLSAGEEKSIQAIYNSIQQTVLVPRGKAIIGAMSPEDTANTLPSRTVEINSFSIGIYPVTNAQYATWLSQALKAKKIVYVEEADNRGHVLDMQGHLLFKTFLADPYSQISAQPQSLETSTFLPLPGKDSYPVINVSWFGAVAYCQDNKCRLPTEAEWEKAAGMEPEVENKPLKKFRYGFGRDEIDPTWANYKENDKIILYFQVLTTPIGFYNGINYLPLSIKNITPLKTHLAKSPYGAFDMSGNVWEWVFDWYDDTYYRNMPEENPQGPKTGTQKVVKGGCYDSLADGVRVSERLGLSPDHTDVYTGFRAAN